MTKTDSRASPECEGRPRNAAVATKCVAIQDCMEADEAQDEPEEKNGRAMLESDKCLEPRHERLLRDRYRDLPVYPTIRLEINQNAAFVANDSNQLK
jgi:hypothetical protein